jgi:hypothetical protein
MPPRQGSPVEWVISTNLRRHLTASQRAVVALDILPLLEREAKERQRLGPGKRVAHDCAKVKASEAAARITRLGICPPIPEVLVSMLR